MLQQLFLFIVLPTAALLVAIPVVSLTLHAHAMRELVGERDSRAARAAAASITEQLNHRAAMLHGLALHAAASPAPESVLADYDFLLEDFEGGLALATLDGRLLASSNASQTWRERPLAETLGRLASQPQATFSQSFVEPGSEQYVMLVAAGLPAGPAAIGAFFPASIGRRALAGIVSSTDQLNAWIVDDRRQLLYAAGPPRLEAELIHHAGVAEALRGESGTTYVRVANGEHVIAFAPVQPANLALLIEEPWEAVDSPLLRRTQIAPLLLIPVLFFALVAVWFGIRQIVQPLQALEQQAADLGWGRFEAVETPVGGISEIRGLQAELGRMAQRVRTAQSNLRSYAAAITSGQEEERRRLARELHDGSVQALVALDHRAQLAQLTLQETAPEAAGHLAELRRMIAALMEDMRRVIRALRPIYLEDLGLLPALEALLRDLEQATGARASLTVEGETARLPPSREITAFRVAQEALSNVARHAQAQKVGIHVKYEAQEFSLQVRDDGRGFDVPDRVSDLAAAGHHGLLGMQERAEMAGGRLIVLSTPGAGTTITLHMPG